MRFYRGPYPTHRVRTKSFAMVLTAPIWFSLAYFFISIMSFFSFFSKLLRSRSSSRMARLIMRLFSRIISFKGFLAHMFPIFSVAKFAVRGTWARAGVRFVHRGNAGVGHTIYPKRRP